MNTHRKVILDLAELEKHELEYYGSATHENRDLEREIYHEALKLCVLLRAKMDQKQ